VIISDGDRPWRRPDARPDHHPFVPLRIADKGHSRCGILTDLACGVAVHTGAMLAVTAAMAGVVYEWMGLAFLRRSVEPASPNRKVYV
jgi:hypothetical protein